MEFGRTITHGVFICLSALLWAADAGAVWGPQGNQISEPSTTQPTAYPLDSRAAVLESGDIQVVWRDSRNFHIWTQRITPQGDPAPGWPAHGRRISTSSASIVQKPSADVIPAPEDGAYVTWAEWEGNTEFIRVKRLRPDGSVYPGWPTRGIAAATGLYATAELWSPRIVDGDFGRSIVVWLSTPTNPPTDPNLLFAQQLDASGNMLWATNGVPVCSRGLNTEYGFDFVAVPDGQHGVFVSFTGNVIPNDRDVFIQRLAPDGLPAVGWNVNGISVSVAPHPQAGIAADWDGATGVHVFWNDYRDGESLYGAHLGADGSRFAGYPPDGRDFGQLGGALLANLSVVHDASAGAFVAWWSPGVPEPGLSVMAVESNGSARWSPGSRLVATGDTYAPRLARDGSGGVFVTWLEATGQVPPYAIRGQRLSQYGGKALPSDGVVLRSYSANAHFPYNDVVLSLNGTLAVGVFDGQDALQPDSLAACANILYASSNLAYPGTPPNGWMFAGVPSNIPGASEQRASISPQLDGEGSTWVSASFTNLGPYATPPSVARLTLDEESTLFELPAVQDRPVGTSLHPNLGPYVVRGGRHCLSLDADALDDVPESDESDNVWMAQFVWSPWPLDPGAGLGRHAPPSPCLLPLPSADGFEMTRPASYAWVVAIAPRNPGDDYDLHVYDDYSGSQSGFSNLVGVSMLGANATDFVVGHYSGTPTTLYPAAVRYAIGGGGQDYQVDQQNAGGRNGGDAASFIGQQLVGGRLADVYEAFLDADVPRQFLLRRTAGGDDLAFGLFPATPGGIFARHEALASSTASGDALDILDFTPAETGWHPIVVFRTDGTESDVGAVTYDFSWGRDLTTAIDESDGGATAEPRRELAFLPPAPSPTLGATTLSFDLPASGAVRLDVIDVTGRRVRNLLDGPVAAGRSTAVWDGTDARGARATGGIYFARFEAPGGRVLTRRIHLLR